MSACEYASVSAGAQEARGVGSSGAAVTHGCERPGLAAGNLAERTSAFSH